MHKERAESVPLNKSNFMFMTPTKTIYKSKHNDNVYEQNILAKTCSCIHGSVHDKKIADGKKETCYHLREILEWLRSVST
jgi:hypothetical protein